MPRSRSQPISVAKRIALAYLVICILMYVMQRSILFLPDPEISPPSAYGLVNFTVIPLTTSDGMTVETWYRPAKKSYPTLIYFHGNGSNLGTRHRYFKLLSDAGYGILALDYRGYGNSTGSPSESGLYEDARTTISYAQTQLKLTPAQTILYGESIGTGVAVQMATEFKSAALVLQSPYTSITAMAQRNYPWLPVRLLLRDHFDSLSKITNVHAPLLLIHGEEDYIVPIRFGKELFAAANEPKTPIYIPGYGHGNLYLAALTQRLTAFCIAQKIIKK